MFRFAVLLVCAALCRDVVADDWHVLRVRAAFAFAKAEESVEKKPESNECPDCFGTGKRGDGRVTFKCPTCNGTGKRKSGEAPVVTQEAEPIGVVKLLVVVGRPRECPPCEQWKREQMPVLKKSGWTEGKSETDHFEVLTWEELDERYGVSGVSLPSFIVTIDGVIQEDSIIKGYTPADRIANHVNSYRVGSRQKTAKSIVRVVMTGRRSNATGLEQFMGLGTGVVIDSRSDGFTVLTAQHCVADADTTDVEVFGNGEVQKYAAKVISADKAADIALLDVASDEPLPAVEMSEEALPEGTRLFAWGCDEGGEPVFRETTVGRLYEVDSIPYLRTVGDPSKGLEGDPAQGRSGGGLFWKGKLVAIYTHANREDKNGICVRVSAIRRLKGLK